MASEQDNGALIRLALAISSRPRPSHDTPGTVNPYDQPEVGNADGTTSTVDTIGVQDDDGREAVLPRVTPDGRHLDSAGAIDEYQRTGRHLGKFQSVEDADAFAAQLHDDYAAGRYGALKPQASHVTVTDPTTGQSRQIPLAQQDLTPPLFQQLQDRSRLRAKAPGDDQFLSAPDGRAQINDLNFRARQLPGVGISADAMAGPLPDKGEPMVSMRQLGGLRVPENATSQLDPVAVLGPQELSPPVRKGQQWVAKALADFKVTDLPQTARPSQVYKKILENGGYTVNPHTGALVEPGKAGPVMVGKYPNGNARTTVIERSKFKPDTVKKWFEKNYDVFSKDNDKKQELHIGGWVAKGDDGVERVYLDVAKGEPDVRKAVKTAEMQKHPKAARDASGQLVPRGQMAVWDPAQGQYGTEVPVGNVHEFINSPEFRQRMDAMMPIGREAMQGGNWWNLRGGAIEHAYGSDRLPIVAGMAAATSPQQGVEPNVRMMTEYVRRVLKGEPIIQRKWRMPKDAVGFEPGLGMPMEQTHKNNVQRVANWDMEALRRDKVNDMFHALMGDINAVVLDRHWAKIGEAPERGVFVEREPNLITGNLSKGKDRTPYADMENVIRDAARDAGVTPADYSAWVWEGIRKTIKETGELFGTKYDAAAIPGRPEGFNEVFQRLLEEKAARKNLSVEEFTERLRKGDATLLSTMLATGVGVEALTQWRQGQLDAQ